MMVLSTSSKLYLIGAVIAMVFVGAIGWRIYHNGKLVERARQTQTQNTALTQAATVSRETAETRAVEQTQVQQEAQRVETIIRDRIVRVPVAAGPADPDILRAVSAAHDAAICAAQRVQRAECRPAATPAANEQ